MEPGHELKLNFENIIFLWSRVIIFLSKMGSFTFSSLLVTHSGTKCEDGCDQTVKIPTFTI